MLDYINDARLDDMLDNIYDQMTAGNYYQAAGSTWRMQPAM